jgi:hypothetical protein
MPKISRAFVKIGLLYFVAAGLFAVFSAATAPYWLNPTWLHIFVVGWITHLIFGVASWMFPKFSKEAPRGNERLGYASLALLNAGLLLRIVAEPMPQLAPSAAMLTASALTQWLGGLGLVVWTWPRVRGK